MRGDRHQRYRCDVRAADGALQCQRFVTAVGSPGRPANELERLIVELRAMRASLRILFAIDASGPSPPFARSRLAHSNPSSRLSRSNTLMSPSIQENVMGS
jgi:hypothetical protein